MERDSRYTALIAGASGMTGRELLKQLLEDDRYDKIITLVRKPSGLLHPKLEEQIFDFDKPDDSRIHADHVFCCLGTTIGKAGSREAFYKVDFSYPLELAEMAEKKQVDFFGIITATGADSKSLFFYNRVKGDIENALRKTGLRKLGIFRPSMLLGDRKEARTGERIGQVVMAWLDWITPKKYKAIQASKVASSMIDAAFEPWQGARVIDSGEMYG